MSTATDDNIMTMCANCGKGEEGSDCLKACAACMMVKYCNRDCQIAHRPQHKKACKKRAAELHEEALFKEHPPPEDCPICFLPLPFENNERTFKSCCGKLICNGCIYAMIEESFGRGEGGAIICAFCREPTSTSDADRIKRVKKLMENGNAKAFDQFAGFYDRGEQGMQQDEAKANELYLRAGELGCAEAYFKLGIAYQYGSGVQMDMKKAKYFYELAAMNGDTKARHNLGCMDARAGNFHRAYKHFILSARAGDKDSLDQVKEGFMGGIIKKDEYANTLRTYQQRHDEMKSDDRDEAQCWKEARAKLSEM